MKALRWHGKERVSIDKVPLPAITEPKDVIVRITGTTVCGSDLHLYHGEILQLKDGDIFGHEFMGIVDEVGPEVTKVKKGDRVVASFQIACGECKMCKEGLTSMCDTTNSSTVQEKMYGRKLAGIFGYSHFTGGYAGGQAEYARVPFGDANLLKIPDHVPDEKALYLSDIVPTSYHAVKCADGKEGSIVGIWGLGPIGLLAARWAQLEGAKRVIGIDNVKERIDLAKEKLGIDIINFDEVKDVVDEIHKFEPQGVDCAIDAAGFRYAKSIADKVQRAIGLETDTSETVNEILRSTRKFGTISLIADYAATTNKFLIGALMEKGIILRGAGQCPVQMYWHGLLKKIQDGVDEFAELYNAFDKKQYGIMKTFIETRFSTPPTAGTSQTPSLKAGNF
ncbi:GroES-like protein [Choiromyces venosus 120613-1]|uniref:GroES-like protein n=1 Tax=Choiromyces venosus 120613-1 TaxID=1336337 RepID=A0A3N4J3N5_9PEZI|nr:GroES-like protein [Choiromyces venosus 120613-1]